MSVSAVQPWSGANVRLTLLSGPRCTVADTPVTLPESSARVLAFIALHGRSNRREVAGVLWPDADEDRAAGNLRSALWRLHDVGAEVLTVDRACLELSAAVAVDVQTLAAWAHRLVTGSHGPEDLLRPEPWPGTGLLPGWYDDWVLFARERFRQQVLHALEAQSGLLLTGGRFGEAVDSALLAVELEPLRESARRALIEAHQREHNMVEARRCFREYAVLVRAELGVDPSRDLAALVR